jgi:transposase
MKRLLTLTDDQRAALVRRYKTEKNVRLRDRIQCVLLKADGRTNRDIAGILHTSEPTVNAWLDRYDEGGLDALCHWDIGGSEGYLSAEQIAQFTTELDTWRFQTAKQAAAWVLEQFGVTYSERGMRSLLHRLGYAHQKARLVPAQADPEAQAAFLKGVRPPQERADGDGADTLRGCRPLLAQCPAGKSVGQARTASRLLRQCRTRSL